MNKTLLISIIVGVFIFGSVIVLKSVPSSSAFIWDVSRGGTWLLPLVSIAALIDSINPCAFGILLLTIAFLLSLGKMRSGILKIGAVYILGLFVVYFLIGLGIVHALHFFNTPHFMAKVGALLLVVLGMFNFLAGVFPSFPIRFRIPHAAHSAMARLMEHASIPTAFLLGLLVGLCEFPCTGGPYLMVLGLLHDSTTYTVGLGYLFLYNAIFVLPLVIILLIASNAKFVERIQTWKKSNTLAMKLWSGLAMVLLGIIIFLF
ncbi:MAG: hypothetical protein COU07_01075 [Candidatus Harrisonbacteria bacterium CG10_big_fil_rev_8_21_14_0_10_40_38]|uniref:Uncharacterized protein n=1 Tax=Candidatus Harrisonbacteria bacterium CG10_big_fil_rev_8_21_14_0_10_40_38 TaxID=1974583 RepID=A0A2H0UUZ9_9BACT|nr:MAG: hypothetical protein COU07_01075 [Candidatus Harrisonbacteria bacterium CG10_big_fil_rev_8_21_14_0_10_40_38]